MRSCARWFYLVTGLVAAFIAVAAIVQAIRQGSWGPIISVGWLPAVIVASRPGAVRRCLRGRSGGLG
jgi:hypothetical protein